MPVRDTHHYSVVRALIKEGWTVTDDPFRVLLLERLLYIDLRAEKASQHRTILVEIKEFTSASQVEALWAAIGKYDLYLSAMKITGLKDDLYLAVPAAAFYGIISETLGQEHIQEHQVRLIVFDPETEEILQWIP